MEEELLDISDVEKVEEMQQKAWLHQQGYLFMEVKQSILNGANAAVDAFRT